MQDKSPLAATRIILNVHKGIKKAHRRSFADRFLGMQTARCHINVRIVYDARIYSKAQRLTDIGVAAAVMCQYSVQFCFTP